MKKIVFTIIFILTFLNLSSYDKDGETIMKDDSKNNIDSAFIKFTKPKTPAEFYNLTQPHKYYSEKKKDSVYFLRSNIGFIFYVVVWTKLYENNKKIHYSIDRVNYNEKDNFEEYSEILNKAWDSCELSIKNEIKNWQLRTDKIQLITSCVLIFEFNDGGIRNYPMNYFYIYLY